MRYIFKITLLPSLDIIIDQDFFIVSFANSVSTIPLEFKLVLFIKLTQLFNPSLFLLPTHSKK